MYDDLRRFTEFPAFKLLKSFVQGYNEGKVSEEELGKVLVMTYGQLRPIMELYGIDLSKADAAQKKLQEKLFKGEQ